MKTWLAQLRRCTDARPLLVLSLHPKQQVTAISYALPDPLFHSLGSRVTLKSSTVVLRCSRATLK